MQAEAHSLVYHPALVECCLVRSNGKRSAASLLTGTLLLSEALKKAPRAMTPCSTSLITSPKSDGHPSRRRIAWVSKSELRTAPAARSLARLFGSDSSVATKKLGESDGQRY